MSDVYTLSDQGIPDAAAQTVFFVTILFFQLYQCLTITSVFYIQTTLFPHPCDIVVFCLELFQQIEGTVA